MKIKQVENRVNASYNTIKNFIMKDSNYYEMKNDVIHVTDHGLQKLEDHYGIRGEILTDDNILFYKNQIMFLKKQLDDNKMFSNLFVAQIESKDNELRADKERIKELEKIIHERELNELELKHQLEVEKNKSLWRKVFNK